MPRRTPVILTFGTIAGLRSLHPAHAAAEAPPSQRRPSGCRRSPSASRPDDTWTSTWRSSCRTSGSMIRSRLPPDERSTASRRPKAGCGALAILAASGRDAQPDPDPPESLALDVYGAARVRPDLGAGSPAADHDSAGTGLARAVGADPRRGSDRRGRRSLLARRPRRRRARALSRRSRWPSRPAGPRGRFADPSERSSPAASRSPSCSPNRSYDMFSSSRSVTPSMGSLLHFSRSSRPGPAFHRDRCGGADCEGPTSSRCNQLASHPLGGRAGAGAGADAAPGVRRRVRLSDGAGHCALDGRLRAAQATVS